MNYRKRKNIFITLLFIFTISFNYVLVGCQDSTTDELFTHSNSSDEYNDSIGVGGDGDNLNPTDSTDIVNTSSSCVWSAMLSHSSADGRQEAGCYLYENINTGEQARGTIKYGPIITGDIGSNGSIAPGSGMPSSNGFDRSQNGEWRVIGYIHAHTTVEYLPNDSYRIVGPSRADSDWAEEQGIPIYTVDYVGHLNDDGDYCIDGGTQNGAHKIYTSNP